MKQIIEISDYDPSRGVRLCWVDGFMINVVHEPDGAVLIAANKEGLISLAKHLLALSDPNVPSGSHMHLDSESGLEDGSNELILCRQDKLSSIGEGLLTPPS